MLSKLALKVIKNRKKRSILLIVNVALAASLLVTATTVKRGFSSVVDEASDRYGANVLVVPSGLDLTGGKPAEFYIDESAVGQMTEPFLPLQLTKGRLRENTIVIAGTRLGRVKEVNPAWMLDGENINDRSAIAGRRLAERFDLTKGETVQIQVNGKEQRFNVSGTLSSGGSEDGYLFLVLNGCKK